MGKLLCDSTAFQTSSPAVHWRGTETAVDVFDQKVVASLSTWNDVIGLEDQQRRRLQRIEAKGVLWTCPPRNSDSSSDSDTSASPSTDRSIVFRLSHGGNVLADGNCLFTASQRAMMARDIDAKELRSRTVRKFLEDFGSASSKEQEVINDAIRHMYSPDLKNGWGIHVVQEVKLLAPKKDRISLALAIEELVQLGMQRELAAEAIYKERCIAVTDGPSWAKYMGISGSSHDEYDIVTLQYTENGLLSVDENIEGRAAAFGDDIAIECMATEFKREIYVVQAHGTDAMVDEDNCVFFLPHRPRSEISELPFFLFMKGSGWCGAGADHYEPLIANPSPLNTHEKVAVVL